MIEAKIVDLFLSMSDEDQGVFAAGLCDHLQGYYFVNEGTGENLTEDHVLKALKEWAADEKRMGASV